MLSLGQFGKFEVDYPDGYTPKHYDITTVIPDSSARLVANTFKQAAANLFFFFYESFLVEHILCSYMFMALAQLSENAESKRLQDRVFSYTFNIFAWALVMWYAISIVQTLAFPTNYMDLVDLMNERTKAILPALQASGYNCTDFKPI